MGKVKKRVHAALYTHVSSFQVSDVTGAVCFRLVKLYYHNMPI